MRRAYDAARADIARASAELAKSREERSSGLVALPAISYAPETDLSLGGYAMLFKHFGDPDLTRPSSFELNLTGTTRKQVNVGVYLTTWLLGDRLNVVARTEYSYFPNTFFGIGNDTSLEQAESYAVRSYFADLTVRVRVIPHVYVGGKGAVDSTSLTETSPDGELAKGLLAGGRGGLIVGLGPSLLYDSRDQVYGTRKGTHVELTSLHVGGALGADFRYDRLSLDARQFVSFGEHTLGFQLQATAAQGEVPWYQLPSIGGDPLRGIFTGRFRDHGAAQAQAEYRFPLFWRFSGTAFAGTGRVIRRLEDFHPAGLKPIWGAGFRYALVPEQRLNLRFDLAESLEGVVYYLNVGEAF